MLYLEHKYLYRRIKEELPEDDYTVPFGKAAVRRKGSDLGIITYGAPVYTALDAAGNGASEAGFVVVPHDQGGVVDPIEVAVNQNEAGAVLGWGAVPGAQTYDVIRGDLGQIEETPVVINLGSVTCIEDNSADVNTVGWEDPAIPSSGEGFFYLVEYFDGTTSSYGTESASKPRAPGAGDCD